MMMKFCFTSTETVGLLGTGAQDGHLNFHTAPELCTDARGAYLALYSTHSTGRRAWDAYEKQDVDGLERGIQRNSARGFISDDYKPATPSPGEIKRKEMSWTLTKSWTIICGSR